MADKRESWSTWRRSELTGPPCNQECPIGAAPPEKQRALCALRALLLNKVGLPPAEKWRSIAAQAEQSSYTPHHVAGMAALTLTGDNATAALAHQCAAKNNSTCQIERVAVYEDF